MKGRAGGKFDLDMLYEWTMGGGIMMVEGMRQINRIAKGLRDNDIGVRIALDDHHEDRTKPNVAVRQGALLGVLLAIFLAGMHWSSSFPAPVSTVLTSAALLAAAAVLWILLRIA